MTQQLDPSSRNELGKGILDPETEQRLLAQGVTYARRVFGGGGFYKTEDGQRYFLSTATTPINLIAANVLKPPYRSKKI